jgi:type IV secretory pathway VirD2 relaxase
LGANARRVVIKSRFVVLKKAGAKSVSTHLRYIERDGVTRDGRRGQAYGADADRVDLKDFEERGRGDRHQFRFIVSAEDAIELEDLCGFTREFMRRMSVDLEAPLDWVAVDHWDTDNPHTHIVLRGWIGSERKGQDLVIAPDYMAHGMRMRASEIATEWLGPRTETEIRHSLLREVDQERFTSLDRTLLKRATLEIVDLTGQPEDHQRQNVLRARVQRLEAMALAERIDANRWRLVPGMEKTLTALGERGDILSTMHRAMKGEQRELATAASSATPIVGRIVAKGLADELHDRGYLVVDGIDGRAHYLRLPACADLAILPVGGIVEARPPEQERAVDRTIAAVARDGLYQVTAHLGQLKQVNDIDPQGAVDVHVRRLEALSRAGVVERVTDGVWKVPQSLVQQAEQHDARKAAGPVVELRSYLAMDQQLRAIGATWLDRQLLGDDASLATRGFGAQVCEAMRSRAEFLVEQGLAERRGPNVILARNLLSTLRDRELAAVGKSLQDQMGQSYRPLRDGERASGVYRRSMQLVSGRFAVLDDGLGFSLVPWRPVIEQYLGQQVSTVARGSSVSWHVGRQRGISI